MIGCPGAPVPWAHQALTVPDGGLGIAFLAPVENSRYFLPCRPLVAPPISVALFFSERSVEVIRCEFVWVWALLLMGPVVVEAKRTRPRPGDPE